MSAELHTLFATPVIVSNHKPTQQLHDFLIKQNQRVVEHNGSMLYGEVSENIQILRTYECMHLREKIIEEANVLAKQILGYEIQSMVDVLSWISIKKPKQQHIMHVHPNSVISGVYYFDEHIEDMPIIFGKQRPEGYNTIRVHTNEAAGEQLFSSSAYKIQPKFGDLVLFPSHLQHTVDVNNTDRNRYSLAFNLMPRYMVGHPGDLTHFFYADAT